MKGNVNIKSLTAGKKKKNNVQDSSQNANNLLRFKAANQEREKRGVSLKEYQIFARIQKKKKKIQNATTPRIILILKPYPALHVTPSSPTDLSQRLMAGWLSPNATRVQLDHLDEQAGRASGSLPLTPVSGLMENNPHHSAWRSLRGEIMKRAWVCQTLI